MKKLGARVRCVLVEKPEIHPANSAGQVVVSGNLLGEKKSLETLHDAVICKLIFFVEILLDTDNIENYYDHFFSYQEKNLVCYFLRVKFGAKLYRFLLSLFSNLMDNFDEVWRPPMALLNQQNI